MVRTSAPRESKHHKTQHVETFRHRMPPQNTTRRNIQASNATVRHHTTTTPLQHNTPPKTIHHPKQQTHHHHLPPLDVPSHPPLLLGGDGVQASKFIPVQFAKQNHKLTCRRALLQTMQHFHLGLGDVGCGWNHIGTTLEPHWNNIKGTDKGQQFKKN
jgi:hypothetical protein